MTDTRQTRGDGDRDETRRAQRGDRHAFLQLYDRHAPLTWRLALVAGRDRAAAEAAVVGAFAHVLGRADRHDTNRFAPVGAKLLRSARDSAIGQADRIAEPAGLEAIAETKRVDTVRAFDRLPQQWRSVLWLDQVEHCALGTTALAVGMSEPSTAALANRALGGFREQLVQLKVQSPLDPDCRQTTLRLAAYVALALPSRDTVRVRRHLDRCEECRRRLDQLDDVTTHLRGALPALPVAVESLAMGAWFARAHEGAGPIGLRLPGGAPAPAWVERSLAGATAAVVSLGITAAVLLNARGGGTPVPTESALARAEGEQALAGGGSTDDGPTDDATPDGSTIVVAVPSASAAGPASDLGAFSSGSGAGAPTAGSPAPRGDQPGSAPATPPPSAPGPTPTPTPPPLPGDDPSTPPDTQSADPVDQVVGTVNDVVDQACGPLEPVCDVVPVQTLLPQLGL